MESMEGLIKAGQAVYYITSWIVILHRDNIPLYLIKKIKKRILNLKPIFNRVYDINVRTIMSRRFM